MFQTTNQDWFKGKSTGNHRFSHETWQIFLYTFSFKPIHWLLRLLRAPGCRDMRARKLGAVHGWWWIWQRHTCHVELNNLGMHTTHLSSWSMDVMDIMGWYYGIDVHEYLYYMIYRVYIIYIYYWHLNIYCNIMGIWDVQIYSHLVRIWLNVQNSIPIYSRITTIHSIGIQFMFPLSLSPDMQMGSWVPVPWKKQFWEICGKKTLWPWRYPSRSVVCNNMSVHVTNLIWHHRNSNT